MRLTRVGSAVAAGLAAAGFLIAAGLLTATTVPAIAAPAGTGVEIELPATGGGFTRDPAGPLIDVTRMAPGDSVSGVMGVRNGSAATAAVSLAMRNVIANENGCRPAERAEPDGCSPGPGELGDHLVFDIEVASSRRGPYSPTWIGTAAELVRGVELARALSTRATAWVRMSVSLPRSTGNEVESDTFGFDLRITLSGPGSSSWADVAGIQASSGSGHGSASAFTGVPSSVLLVAALLLIVAGGLLVASGAMSRPRPDLG